MQTWDWIFLILAILVLWRADRAMTPGRRKVRAVLAGIGLLLILDQWVVGHTGWLYVVGAFYMLPFVIVALNGMFPSEQRG